MNLKRTSGSIAVLATALLVSAGILLPAIPASAATPSVTIIQGYATSTSIILDWSLPARARVLSANPFLGVVIRRANGDTPPVSPTSGTGVTTLPYATTMTNTNLKPNTEYAYSIFAIYQRDARPSAATWLVRTLPTATSNLKVTAVTNTTVSLSWTNPTESGFTGTWIVRCADATSCVTWTNNIPSNDPQLKVIKKAGETVVHFTDTGLSPDSNYSYSLFAQYPSIAAASSDTVTTRTN
jgi:hypothetical protein